jgi:hypothetical protein
MDFQFLGGLKDASAPGGTVICFSFFTMVLLVLLPGETRPPWAYPARYTPALACSARRMAIDRNLNGVLDGDEPLPSLTAERSDAGLTISWSTNAVGAVLESSDNLSLQDWRTEVSVQTLVTDRFVATAPRVNQRRFFRLRGF